MRDPKHSESGAATRSRRMDPERFLVEHNVNDLLSTFFWVWVTLGLGSVLNKV